MNFYSYPELLDATLSRVLKSITTIWCCLHPAVLYATSLSVAPAVIDVTTLPEGESIQCVDLSIADVEFDLAAFEFEAQFPPYITSFSETQEDWAMGQLATIRSGALFDGRQTQSLPAMMDGTLIAATPAENNDGRRAFGTVVTNRSDVPQGSLGDPHPGGQITEICFKVQNTPLCASKSERVHFRFDETGALFSDRHGTGRVLPSPSLVLQNNNVNYVKVDSNKDGVRDQLDALAASLCALNGKANCSGWEADTDEDFIQTFDFNCDGTVNASDALSLARWALGIQGNAASLEGSTPVSQDVSAFYDLVELWRSSDPLGDIDGDGVVTVLDLVMAAELPVELQFFDIQ